MANKEYKYKINGNNYTVTIGEIEDNYVELEVNGTPYKVELEEAPAPKVAKVAKAAPAAAPKAAAAAPAAAVKKPAAAGSAAGGFQVKAPLPGVVLSIPVKVGDEVKSNDTVLMLEAMKMENAIHAGANGKIASISVAPGDSVLEGTVLITIQ